MNNIFKSIALTFSGGGYRAAGFSLGALSLFEKIGLLQNVKAISTVSGGTITGVKYVESQISKKTFDVFFEEYYCWLKEDKLAGNALSHLKSNKVWNKKENIHKKRKNPINAFSIEYNEFTYHKTLGDIQDLIKKRGTHLERVIFNASDFTNGVEFRFLNIDKQGRKLGNSKVPNINPLVDKIKLGDALAASSAFPGGFEPISFPNDYFDNTDPNLSEIGLMDGGIIDNQGISSLLTSEDEDSLYGLYFINDVASPNISEPFNFSSKNVFIKILTFLSSIPSLILLIGLTIYFFLKSWLLLYSLAIVITFLMFGIQFLLFIAAKKMAKATGIVDKLFIPPRKLGFYILDRINSLIKMSNDVFLKSSRRRNYSRIYARMENRVSTNTIYELRCKNGEPENSKLWESIRAYTKDITPAMKDISNTSAAFGTTLWFSKSDKENNILDKLIACGEYTACYNLISFLVINHIKEIETGGEAHQIFNELLVLWGDLCKNPYAILEGRKQKFKT